MLEGIGLLLHIGVMLVFLVIVLNSKHLHIFVAPLNVHVQAAAGRPRRRPAAQLRRQAGHPRRPRGDGRGHHARHRLHRGLLVEGPARHGDLHRVRPLPGPVPGLEHREAAQPQDADHEHAGPRVPHRFLPPGRPGQARHACSRPTPSSRPRSSGRSSARPRARPGTRPAAAIIDPDVLWSCVTCGACVQQCPVDIEHVDHIIDMRRHQVLVESTFPAELNQLFKGMESKGNPWNLSPNMRMDWAQGLDFEVPGRRRGPRVAGVGRLAVLGRLRRRVRGPRQEDHPRGRRAARTSRASPSAYSARARRAPATPPAAPATSSSSRAWPSRTSRRSRSSRSRRSSRPAPTASTPSRTSTRSSASSWRWSTTPSC